VKKVSKLRLSTNLDSRESVSYAQIPKLIGSFNFQNAKAVPIPGAMIR